MVQDKANGTIRDLRISPVKSATLSLSYYTATLFSTLIICFAATGICLTYVAIVGWNMSLADIFFLFLDILLLVLFGTALSSIINFFLSTQGQISAVGTIISAGYGFICGAYMPISSFGKGLQKIISFLPGTYGTSLIRNHTMQGALAEIQNQGIPIVIIEKLKDSLDCNLYFFGSQVNIGTMYMILPNEMSVDGNAASLNQVKTTFRGQNSGTSQSHGNYIQATADEIAQSAESNGVTPNKDGQYDFVERREMETKGNYYYLYNNVLFVTLNTGAYPGGNDNENAGNVNVPSASKDNSEAEAIVSNFRTTLNAATAEYSGQYQWLVVTHHKSTQTVAKHAADSDIENYVDAGFEQVMDEFDVDFVLGGHDHVYSRSYVLKNGQRNAERLDDFHDPDGVIYLTGNCCSDMQYYFNCSNDSAEIDDRSGKKGVEAESVTIGTVGEKTYAFIGLERIGGVMAYDITNPDKILFANYINSRDFSKDIAGDVSPEGLCMISASESADGNAYLLASCEVSGTVAAYKLISQNIDSSDDDNTDNNHDNNIDHNGSGHGGADTEDLNNQESKTNALKTGDHAPVIGTGIGMVLALSAIIVILKYRRSKNTITNTK